jgi:hypothetical protein
MMHPTTYEHLKPPDEQIERMARVRGRREGIQRRSGRRGASGGLAICKIP